MSGVSQSFPRSFARLQLPGPLILLLRWRSVRQPIAVADAANWSRRSVHQPIAATDAAIWSGGQNRHRQRQQRRCPSLAAAAASTSAALCVLALAQARADGVGSAEEAELLQSCQAGDERRVARLLAGRRGLANARHPLGWTALAAAVANGRTGVASANAEGHKPSAFAKDERVRSLLESAEAAAERLRRRRFPLEQRLRACIVGQAAAIRCVAAAIRRKENGWGDTDHPLVFLFLGSSGVGKTELAKQVSQYLNRDPQHGFVRLDMSEYAEKHEAAKLIGAPPGYVGHENGGQLTQALRRCPSATVLLDEVDKAHPDVLSTLLQLFDEGRLTDGRGRTVSCKDAVFIMTSNLAADQIAEYGLRLRASEGGGGQGVVAGELEVEGDVSREFKDTVVRPILKRHFRRDEFLGRINEIVYFLPFNAAELVTLVVRQLDKWAAIAMERHGVEVTWDPEAVDLLIAGYDCHYGARSLKYEVDRQVVSQLALADELGLLSGGDRVRLVAVRRPDGKKGSLDLLVTRTADGEALRLSDRLRAEASDSSAAAAGAHPKPSALS